MEEFQLKTTQTILIRTLTLAATVSLGYCLFKGLLQGAPSTLFYGPTAISVALFAALSLFGVSCVLTFFWPRWAVVVVLIASAIAFYGLIQSEAANSPWFNSWIAFNIPDREYNRDSSFILIAASKIISVSLASLLAILSTLWLLPSRWLMRGKPLNQRIWPAFVVSFTVLAVWFVYSAVPYRIPIIVDGSWPDLTILHVKKDGNQFYETRLAINRDGQFSVSRNNRRLFQYRFEESAGRGVLPSGLQVEIMALPQVNERQNLRTFPKQLRSWHAEGWYVLGRKGIWVFTTENGMAVPQDIQRLFAEVEKLQVSPDWKGNFKDVCMGFCYDPAAALGFIYVNNRCNNYVNGSARCQ